MTRPQVVAEALDAARDAVDRTTQPPTRIRSRLLMWAGARPRSGPAHRRRHLPGASTAPSRTSSRRRRWWVLATMTGSLSMVMLDQTVVSVALPTMQRDLGLSTAGVQWVVNAYLLVLAVLVAFGGRLADLLGAERTFRAGTPATPTVRASRPR